MLQGQPPTEKKPNTTPLKTNPKIPNIVNLRLTFYLEKKNMSYINVTDV